MERARNAAPGPSKHVCRRSQRRVRRSPDGGLLSYRMRTYSSATIGGRVSLHVENAPPGCDSVGLLRGYRFARRLLCRLLHVRALAVHSATP